MGTQKKHLNETVLLSTQKYMLKLMNKKIFTVYAQKCCLSESDKTHVRIQRGGQGVRTPLKNHKNIGFHINTGFAGGLMMARF